ncbi:hypothetical protein AAE478_009090 [Parahypoxylon ruwenzoriense]
MARVGPDSDGVGNPQLRSQYEFDTIKHHVNFEPAPTHAGQEWRSYPELPTSRDLNPDWDDPQQLAAIRYLLPNTWKEPWKSKNTYLETHYRLQREEAITLLRYSIKKFKDDPTMMDDDETCIYTKVFVRGYLMTRLGPMCQVQFSAERSGKKIRWTQTRRLTVGSLVVLSPANDCFKTICMPAIISDHRIRGGLDQNPPTIHFQWANLDDAIMDPNQELVMVEARFGYFEAVRHSMVGLQHVADTHTTLDKYLVQADKTDLPARYVVEHPEMDISSLVHHMPNSSSIAKGIVQASLTQAKESLRSYPVLGGFDSQLSKYTNLDNSQLGAVHRILTKELAIVQGPPGTGKTFTSVQALHILLESQDRGSNVIIVAAQTNHAVDQILIQLIKLGFNVVRLGGRTQNEDIKRYSMYNLRHRALPPSSRRTDKDYKTFESARKKNIINLQKVIDDVFPDDLVDPESLYSADIISKSQLQSLQADQAWAAAPLFGDQPSGLLAEWLGSQLVKVKPQDDKDPEFEAVESDDNLDLDDEDNDMELDDCIVDEDENSGRIEGKFLPIKHAWTGTNPQGYTEIDLIIHRELQKPNLWDIDVKYRGAIYQYWQKQLLFRHHRNFRHILADNARITKNLKINRWYKDTQCITSSQIEIVGCTTTGLCKYRGLLAALRPRTMLIEEAAETREANILSALYGSLQQLILVGDHQQLAPHCDTPGLADEPYNMRVSMFERLVRLKLPFTMLNMQRRMVPLLREILNPFYPSLQDHPVVTKDDARPPVPGMAINSFFFHHTWTEGLDENASRYNILEAEMVVQFIDYLMMNGVQASQITVLTFYRGQKKKILAQFRNKMKHWVPFTNVYTVDSYQGEENDIVILSLVRSHGPNGPHQAGFLQDENRGVVSISRARRGFYIFGNMINLAYASNASWNMWGRVQKVFERHGRFGGDTRLPITCENHRKTIWMSHPEDWVNCHGGCDQSCSDKMSCGHACGRRCHWVSHDKLICREPCERQLPCGHRCQQICGESCICNCAEFTGAYSHDDFMDAGTILEDGHLDLNYDQSRVAPFITPDQRRMDVVAGGRAARRGRRGARGHRRGLGYDNAGHVASSQNPGRTGFVRPGDGESYTWGAFDIQLDDEQRRMEAQKQVKRNSRQLGATSTLAIRDTFLPVTLNQRGKRHVGGGITSEHSARPSPDKDDDLLDFNDAVETTTVTMRSVDMISGRIGTDALMDTTAEAWDASATSTPTKLVKNSQTSNMPISGPHRATPLVLSPPPGPIESSLRKAQISTPHSGQADKPEWELSSVADTASVMEGGMAEDGEDEDLISL